MILQLANDGVLQDQFCITKEAGKVHISISPATKLLRCGATGEKLIGTEYRGDDADICKRCFASYYRYESRVVKHTCGLCGRPCLSDPHQACVDYEAAQAD